MADRRWLRRNRTTFLVGVGVAIVGVAVLLWHGPTWLDTFRGLTPEQRVTAIDTDRGRILQFAGGVVAVGVLVFTGFNYWLSREGHVTDRFSKAIEQLGNTSLDVRLGGIYALERIMIDSKRDHPTIVEVLAAFVREHSPKVERRRSLRDDTMPEPPTVIADVQAALTVLGRRPQDRVERGFVNLRDANLTGAFLADAFLRHADLSHSDLIKVNLRGADLAHAVLLGADLTRAHLSLADMSHAALSGADFTGTWLSNAKLPQHVLENPTLPPDHLAKIVPLRGGAESWLPHPLRGLNAVPERVDTVVIDLHGNVLAA